MLPEEQLLKDGLVSLLASSYQLYLAFLHVRNSQKNLQQNWGRTEQNQELGMMELL